MYFYIDESGHTGSELFDENQPTLYYGVLSSDVNLDILIESRLRPLRKKLDVERLHAAELGNGRLALISKELFAIQKQFKLRFDFYRVRKPDHAIISFYDQVFDQAMNPAVTWSSYWTPLRYVILLKLATLFTEDMGKAAWKARLELNDAKSQAGLVSVCQALLGELNSIPDARSRQLIGDGLNWAIAHPADISYNVAAKASAKQISPNIIGFQSVMHGIASRLGLRDKRASQIVVDRQSEFNQAQRTLAEFFAAASGMKWATGPGMPIINFSHMPKTPIEFKAGTDSAGLELVDIYLWIFKRVFEGKEIADELVPIYNSQLHKGKTDEVSLRALEERWERYFSAPMPEMSPEQLTRAQQLIAFEEAGRQARMAGLPNPTPADFQLE